MAETQKQMEDRLARLKASDPGDMTIDLDDVPTGDKKPAKKGTGVDEKPPTEDEKLGKFEKFPEFEEMDIDLLTKDLQLKRLGIRIAREAESTKRINPKLAAEKKEKNEPILASDEILKAHAELAGFTVEDFKKAAEFQEAPIQNFFQDIGDEGRPVQEVFDAYKTQESLWSKTQQQRKVLARGEKVRIKGIERVVTGEKKLSPEKRKETLQVLLAAKDPRLKSRIFTGDADSGEAENAIAKPGQAGYDRLMMQANKLIDTEIADDKEQAEIYQSHIAALGPPTTGAMIRNTLGERKFQEMVNQISTHKLNKMAKRQGVQRGTEAYEQLRAKSNRDALYEAALLRTVNKYYLPGFVQYDQIDPGNVRGAEDTKDKWWITQAMKNAADVRIEVVGLDPKGIPVYRLTSPTWHIFEMADSVQAGIAGAIERLSDDERDESILTAIREGSLDGIRNRRDFLKAALSSEAAENGGLASFAMGSAGLVAAILTPDLFMGAAAVARTTKRVAQIASETAGFRRAAPVLVESLGDGATNYAKTEDVLEAAEAAVARGDYDAALLILEEAKTLAKKGDEALSKARGENVEIAREVDRLDVDIAARMGKRVPESTFAEGKRVASKIPGSFGETAQNVHMGARRVMLRGESLDQFTGFPELLSFEKMIDSLKESVDILKSGDLKDAFNVKLREMVANPFRNAVDELLTQTGVGVADVNRSVALRQQSLDLMTFLNSTKSTRILRDDPQLYRSEVIRIAKKIDFDDADKEKAFFTALEKRFPDLLDEANNIGKTLSKVSIAEARQATSRGIAAIRGNLESRAASSAFIRERVAEQAKVAAEPLLIKLTDRYAEVGRDRLSPQALQIQDAILDIYPNIEPAEIRKFTRMMDQEAKKFADSKKGRTVADFYAERFGGIKKGLDDVADEVKPKDVKPETQKDPTIDEVTPKDVAPEPQPAPPARDLLDDVEAGNISKLPKGLQDALRGIANDAKKKGGFSGPIQGVKPQQVLPEVEDAFADLMNADRRTQEIRPAIHVLESSSPGLSARTLYNHVSKMTRMDEVCEFLARHAELDSTRLLAQKILPNLRRDPGQFRVISGKVDDVDLSVRDAHGLYFPNSHRIFIRGAQKPTRLGDEIPIETGLTEETLIHELLHAATAVFIQKNPNAKVVRDLDQLISEVRTGLSDLIKQMIDAGRVNQLGSVRFYARNFDTYIGSADEFLVRAMTDPKFQRLLKLIKVTPRLSIWNKFTRAVASIFGIRKEDETTALSQALIASERLIQKSVKFDQRPASDAEPIVKVLRPTQGTPGVDVAETAFPDGAMGDVFITSPKLRNRPENGITLQRDNLSDFLSLSGIRIPRPDSKQVVRVSNSFIDVSLRGRGFGTDLYLRALKYAQNEGVAFASDVSPTGEALRVYEKLRSMGVEFRRLPVRLADGSLGEASYIDAASLAKIDLDDLAVTHGLRNRTNMFGPYDSFDKIPSKVLYSKLSDTSDPLVVEFLENGQAIIRAIGETASVDDFIRVLGRISRRDLDEKGMNIVTDWLKTRGINVGFQGAKFTSANPADIERAESEFASAFAAYVDSGRATKPELVKPFNAVREWVSGKYTALRSAEADGAPLEIDDRLTLQLDKMMRVPSKRVGMPNIIGMLKDALIKPDLGGTSVDVLEEIARESFRLGTPIKKKDLQEQFTKALKAYNAGRKEEAVIRLPGPVSIRGWNASSSTGAKEFTLDELADIQQSLETAKRMELQESRKLGMPTAERAIKERNPSELVDQWVTQNPVRGAFRFMYLGGDAFADMRLLPPVVRDAIMAGTRAVQQAIGDAITLVAEKDIAKLTQLLTGDPNVQFTKGGRSAISAGHDHMASVSHNLGRYFSSVNQTNLGIVRNFVQRVRVLDSTAKAAAELSAEELGKVSEIVNDLISGDKASRFVTEVFKAAGFTGSRIEPKFFTEPATGLDPGGLLEILMYYGNVSGRVDPAMKTQDGRQVFAFFNESMKNRGAQRVTSKNMFTGLYGDINAKFTDDPTVANRVAVLIAGHGQAHATKKRWVDLGVAADEDLARSMRQYIVGESIDPDDVVRVKNAFDSLGYNPNMVEGYALDGVTMFIPRAGRERLNMVLAQAQDPSLLKTDNMDTISALNEISSAGERIITGAGTNSTTALSFALFYRYLKTRMVRGHFVLKSRYFWMNTFDHFNQTAQRAGFRTAAISTTRMFTQNVLSNPIGQAFVFAARRTGKGDAAEAARRVLQEGGDKAAEWAGKLTRGSKWHIKLNPILEGADGIVMIAGKPYRNADIRQVALEAGIFASFDTSQLGTKIQNVGNLFLQTEAKKGRLTKLGTDILDDVKGASEDIAEAWAERERLGCMITLMEAGIDPRTAAKISIEALYDYAGSMSKGDRNFLLNIFFPFWAFQKNANRQIFDAIFSPEGAYRLGVMRRAYDKGSEYLSYLTYGAMVDENGIAVDSLPPELRSTYFAFKKQMQDLYGENGKIPAPIQEEIRLFVAQSMIKTTGGKVMQGSVYYDDFIDIAASIKGEDGKSVGLDRRALASYYMPIPDKSGLQTYFRDRISFPLPYAPEKFGETPVNYAPPEDFQNSTKAWNDLYRQKRADAPYMAFFMPEPTYVAAFNHFSYLMATKILMMQKMEDMGDRWFTDEDDGSDAITPLAAVNALLSPARAPVLSDVQASLGTGGATIPKRVAQDLVHFFDYHLIDLLELDESEDIFDIQLQQQRDEAEGREPRDLPIKPIDAPIVPTKRYYMMPGVAQMLFINSPLGELNDILLKAEKTPMEKASGIRGDVQKWLRVFTGLDQREIIRDRTVMSELFRAEDQTSDVTKERAGEKTELD